MPAQTLCQKCRLVQDLKSLTLVHCLNGSSHGTIAAQLNIQIDFSQIFNSFTGLQKQSHGGPATGSNTLSVDHRMSRLSRCCMPSLQTACLFNPGYFGNSRLEPNAGTPSTAEVQACYGVPDGTRCCLFNASWLSFRSLTCGLPNAVPSMVEVPTTSATATEPPMSTMLSTGGQQRALPHRILSRNGIRIMANAIPVLTLGIMGG